MCADTLWVDVGNGIGRNLSWYWQKPAECTMEHSAAKPNQGFAAFDKPSYGETERQRHIECK